jgi:hypothetical protein
MQTFLPDPDFEKCATILDYRRLGKQRVESMQILNALKNPQNRWHNHVVVRMWQGWEDCLKYYTNCIIHEWVSRGFDNDMLFYEVPIKIFFPPWLGDERLHKSHKCNLMRKLPDYYKKFNWTDIDVSAPYWWPVELKDTEKQEKMIAYWGRYE